MFKITTKYEFVLELVEDVLNQARHERTKLLICSTREDFLDQLQTLVLSWQPPQDPEIPASQEDPGEESPEPVDQDVRHAFLVPTLHLLTTSKDVGLAFCPSINSLRAFVSTLELAKDDSISCSPSKIVIVNLLALHYGTSEFTLQGLSRTFATVVSTAHRLGSRLELVECKDAHDPSDPTRGPFLWESEVPLLSGSIKIGGAGANWATRSIAVKTVAERWFELEDEEQK